MGAVNSWMEDFGGDDQPAERRRRGRRRPSPLLAIGLLLVLAGLGCLGWVGYAYFGTNLVAERAFAEERAGLREAWAADRAAPTASQPPASKAAPGQPIGLLRIPAFGADFEVPIMSGVELSVLERGVGHYPTTAGPGAVGNFALAGHRVTHGQPFSRLLELRPGDEVVVETRDAVYTYVIVVAPRDLTVPDDAAWVLDPVPRQPGARPRRALLTLTTCQDLFRSADRSVGFAQLATTVRKR